MDEWLILMDNPGTAIAAKDMIRVALMAASAVCLKVLGMDQFLEAGRGHLPI